MCSLVVVVAGSHGGGQEAFGGGHLGQGSYAQGRSRFIECVLCGACGGICCCLSWFLALVSADEFVMWRIVADLRGFAVCERFRCGSGALPSILFQVCILVMD